MTTHSRGETTAYAKQVGRKSVEEYGATTPQNRSEFVGNPRAVSLPVWNCVEGCPVREMDAQSGKAGAAAPASGPTYSGPSKSGSMAGAFAGLGDKPPVFHNDTGGASRFFPAFRYQAKASRRERNAGLEGMPEGAAGSLNLRTDQHSQRTGNATAAAANHHPTVKPVELMRWLCRLVTPPGGVVLDPFTGSGTTGVAAVLEGFDFIGIEREPGYAEIAERRIAHAQADAEAAPVHLAL